MAAAAAAAAAGSTHRADAVAVADAANSVLTLEPRTTTKTEVFTEVNLAPEATPATHPTLATMARETEVGGQDIGLPGPPPPSPAGLLVLPPLCCAVPPGCSQTAPRDQPACLGWTHWQGPQGPLP